jgi:hypothetical protein
MAFEGAFEVVSLCDGVFCRVAMGKMWELLLWVFGFSDLVLD